LLEQLIFLLEMLAGVVVLAWWLVSRRSRGPGTGEADSATNLHWLVAARLLLLGFSVAFVAGAAGYMGPAILLGSGVLGCGYLLLVFYAGLQVGDALVAFMLRVRPLRLLGMVERRRPLLERRAHRHLRGLAIIGWVIFALRYFGFWSSAVVRLRQG
jgi:hypothetical protein